MLFFLRINLMLTSNVEYSYSITKFKNIFEKPINWDKSLDNFVRIICRLLKLHYLHVIEKRFDLHRSFFTSRCHMKETKSIFFTILTFIIWFVNTFEVTPSTFILTKQQKQVWIPLKVRVNNIVIKKNLNAVINCLENVL